MPKFESWIERQIREAIERGEFDNLPGAGRPIPNLLRPRAEDWWIKEKLEREGIPPPLPTTLALRKEAAQILHTVANLSSEQEVRQVVADLNARILDARRGPVDGPPVVLRTVDLEQVARQWRAGRRGSAEA